MVVPPVMLFVKSFAFCSAAAVATAGRRDEMRPPPVARTDGSRSGFCRTWSSTAPHALSTSGCEVRSLCAAAVVFSSTEARRGEAGVTGVHGATSACQGCVGAALHETADTRYCRRGRPRRARVALAKWRRLGVGGAQGKKMEQTAVP